MDLAGDAKVGIRGPLGIRTGFALNVLPAPVYWYIYGGPELDLRGVTPYAVGWAQSDGTRGVDFGVDVERQIADGPFWLIGRSWLRIGNVPTSARAEIGIRFERGEH